MSEKALAEAPMPSHKKTLARSTLVGVAATGAEFVLLALLVHVRHIAPWVSFAVVQFVAQAITFTLNKYWAFDASRVGTFEGQGLKSLMVFGGSCALNTALPSLGAYRLHVTPVVAFAVSQVVVYLGWNYPLNRYWVFRRTAD